MILLKPDSTFLLHSYLPSGLKITIYHIFEKPPLHTPNSQPLHIKQGIVLISEGHLAAGSRVDLLGPEPRHFAYFAELEAQGGGALPAAPAASLGAWLTAAGRRLAAHGQSTYESLVFGGRLLASAAAAWRSVKRLRIPSVVRHMHETGVQAVPVVAVIALLISIISAYIGAQQLRPYGGEIIQTSLSEEEEQRLRAALEPAAT